MKKVMFMFVLLFAGVVMLVAQDGEPSTGFNWWTVVSGVLAILSTVLGTVIAKARGKLKQLVTLIKEAVEALDSGVGLADTTIKAAEDNVFTAEEKTAMKTAAATFKKERQDVKTAWKALWTKSDS